MEKSGIETILVMCTGNSCRSQMAEGYLNLFLDKRFKVYSAGIEKHGLNQMAVQMMAEDDVDISNHTSNLIDEYLNLQFDLVITVCDHANESCPVFPGSVNKIHQNFRDPSKFQGSREEIYNEFISVRDAIKDYCRQLASQLNSN